MKKVEKEQEGLGTEAKAIKEEKEHREWQKKYGAKLPGMIHKMNQLLSKASVDSILELKRMFLDKNILENYKQTDQYANMYVIMSIYEAEVESGVQHTILSQGRTVEELLDYLFQLKMILYRFDFGIGENIGQELTAFLILHNTSTVNVEIMIHTSVARPLLTALKLEKLFGRYQLKDYEQSIVKFIEKEWEGNYRIQNRLLMEYGQTLNDAEKQKFHENIKNMRNAEPDDKFAFALQECMWKLLYREPDSALEIVAYLKKNKVTDVFWNFLLQDTKIKDLEYYLQMVDGLLEEKLMEKAKITLQYMLDKKPGDELALCLLAEMYIGEYNAAEAQKYLHQVESPTELTDRLQKICYRLENKNELR